MTFQEIKPREAVNLSTILQTAAAEETNTRTRLVTYAHQIYEYHAFEDTLTLVMNRDLNEAAALSSGIAMLIALKHKDKNVLLFNSFASGEQLTRGIVRALHLLHQKVPWTYQRYLPNADKEMFDDSSSLPEVKNVFVLDCPTSTLTPGVIEKQVEDHNVDVVILNSLEFAAFDDRNRRQLAESLLELRNRKHLSVFVFTHDIRPILPRTGGRGIVGLLAAFADSIWPVLHEWELKKWVNRFNFDRFHERNLHTHINLQQ